MTTIACGTLAPSFNHGWMDNRIQILDAWMLRIEGELSQPVTIQQSVCGDNVAAKLRDDCLEHLLAGVHQRATHLIGGEHNGTTLRQHSPNRRLAAAKIPCKSYAQPLWCLPSAWL
jgi:hypothetical protein